MIPQFEQFIKHPNYFRREAKNIYEREDYIDAYTERKRLDRSNGGRGNKQEGNNFDSFMSGNRTDAGNDGIYQRGNETQRKNNGESDNQSRYDSNERKWRDFVDYFFMAKEMCQKQATFDHKAKGYENAIAKKK